MPSRIAVALWNGTLDQTKTDGDARLDRAVRLEFGGLERGRYRLRHRRVDLAHSTVERRWADMGGGDWPSDEQWDALRASDHLEELHEPHTVEVGGDGVAWTSFDLPMPAVSLVELSREP